MTDSPGGDQPATKTFADFDVAPEICDALTAAGISSPFPIQELTLPLALGGADLIGQARTGTGKTLAFGIPLLQRIDANSTATQALVVVPTRELCVQVAADLEQAASNLTIDVLAVYGGKALDPQVNALEKGAHVVVGTPGRLLDLMRRGALHLEAVSGLVLDEADEMLDLGFLPDVEQIIEATASERQTLLFSATMPSAVVALARRYMHKPTFLRADVEEVRIAPETRQHFFSCHRMDKPAVLARILSAPGRGLCVVFTRTKRMADVLVEELRQRDIAAAPIHSDLRQEARERALERFRRGQVDVLCATEVAARGLDIDDVTHVVNYDCPDDEKMYLHRIGRTGRAGAAGVAITLAVWNELARLEMIKRALDVAEPTHEVFSTSPILDELFGLAPREQRRPSGSRQGSAKPSSRPSSRPSSGKSAGKGDRPSKARSDRPASKPRAERAGSKPDAERAAGSKPAPDSEQPTEAKPASKQRSDGRSRRKVRVTDEASGPTETDGAPTPQATDDPGEQRVRVRRRSRSRAPTAGRGSGSDSGSGSGRASTSEPDQDGSPAGSTKAAARTGGKPRPKRSGTPEGEAAAGDQRKPTRSRSRRSSGGRADSKPDRGKDGTPRKRQPAKRGGQRHQVDSDTARGDGKPGLRRSMRISHLP